VTLPLHPGVVEPLSDTGCMIPQSFAVGGKRPCPEFWAISNDPWYMGYFTLTVALEPSIEYAVKNIPSAGGGKGAHMLTTGTTAGFSGEIVGVKPP
jgi:hypothetical protein